MFKDLFYITFFNQYIVSPKTFIHTINNKFKIVIIFAYLCVIPYMNYIYIITSLSIYILLSPYIKIPTKKLNDTKNIFFIILVYLLNIYIYSINFQIDISCNTQNYIIIKQLLFFSNSEIRKYRIIEKNKFYKIFILPNFIMRTSLIYLLYLIFIQTLYLTTKYENIIIYYLIKFKNQKTTYTKQEALIIIFSSSFLVIMNNNFYNTRKAINLRNNQDLFNIFLFYNGLYELFNTIAYDINRISSILYSREINYYNINFKDIYHL